MKLLIISHTPHYKNPKGIIVGWGPTVREIVYLKNIFSTIIHVAPLYESDAPSSCIPYDEDSISFVPIKPAGGNTLKEKSTVFASLLHNLKIIHQQVNKADWVQLRTPCNIGLYTLPYLFFRPRKNIWYKYAGNWIQQNAPITYRFQRWWLKKINSKRVTINGSWPLQESHIFSFENPCLTDEEIVKGSEMAALKIWDDKLTLCFVGNLEPNKGPLKIIEALNAFSNPELFEEIIFVGDGNEFEKIKKASCKVKVTLTGFLKQTEVHAIYAKAHFNILPSLNEGFPKVIAEASAFGCIPVVSNISSLGQYIRNSENGFLLEEPSVKGIVKVLNLLKNSEYLKGISEQTLFFAKRFTYSNYCHQLRQKILQ